MLLTGETRFARRIAGHSATLATTCIVEVLNPGFHSERPTTNSVGGGTLAAFEVKDTYARVDRREQRAFPKCIAYRQVREKNTVVSCNPRIHKKTLSSL